MIEVIWSTVVLFLLGILGWNLFAFLRIPAAAMLGSLAVLGTLRAIQVPLPVAPYFVFPFVQVMLGLFIGAKVTRETVRELKNLLLPAIVIVTWTLSVVFIFGDFLSHLTYLDIYTSILSSSMGGLPEMTIIAMSTSADIAVVIVMQTFRMVLTIAVFPMILQIWVGKNNGQQNITKNEELEDKRKVRKAQTYMFQQSLTLWFREMFRNIISYGKEATQILYNIDQYVNIVRRGLLPLGIAIVGGFLFFKFGVPAGAMIGSMFFVAVASLLGTDIKPPSSRLYDFMLVGVGVMVADNISPQTIKTLTSGELLIPIFVSTMFIFLSSFLVAFITYKLTGWDFPTSFLAAAPGGFTVMSTLAVKYGKNPFGVSMLHLCRLLAIKIVVPFVFMFFV